MPRLADETLEQTSERPLLLGGQHSKEPVLDRVCVGKGALDDATPLGGQRVPDGPAVVRIRRSPHQTAAFERCDRELRGLRRAEKLPGEIGPGQPRVLREPVQDAQLGGGDVMLSNDIINGALRVMSGLPQEEHDVVAPFGFRGRTPCRGRGT